MSADGGFPQISSGSHTAVRFRRKVIKMEESNISKGGVFRIEAAGDAQTTARILARQLTERGFAVGEGSPALTIRLTILPDGMPEEGFRIESRAGQVNISAVSKAGLHFGAGAFLRRLGFHADGSVTVPAMSFSDKPKMPWRAVMTCYHRQDNGYKDWDVERERLFMEDMAFWGAGMAMFSPLNMWQRNSRTFVPGTPENDDWKTMAAMPETADALGLKYGMLNVPNDVFRDDLEHCRTSVPGAGPMIFAEQPCACPSDPRAWEIILKRREEFFSRMKRIDFLYIHTSDYGACACKECGPYIPTYLRLAREVAAVLRRYHPKAKVCIGTVLITEEGIRKYILPYLNSEESGWLDGVVYGMHGTALSVPEFIEAMPKGKFELVLYPEITMAENWGRIGAAPWVKHFDYSLRKRQDMGAACIALNRWPNTSERMFGEGWSTAFEPDEMKDLIAGAFVYSEGLHDDLAKIMWLRYCWDPSVPREEILAEYCRFYFGEEAARDAAEVILKMEELSYRRVSKYFCPALTANDDGTGLSVSREILARLNGMKAKMPEWAAESWRFRFYELRALIDAAAFERREGFDVSEKKTRILDLAEAIRRQTLHVNLLPAGTPWDREKAAASLEKLLTPPQTMVSAAPTAPMTEK